MLKFFDNINLYVYNARDWQIFASRLKQIDNLPDTTDSEKRAILLQNVTEDTYRLIGQLVYPHRLEIQTFKSLYEIILHYLNKHTPVSAYKEQVHRAVKAFGENIEDWVDKLKELTKPCDANEDEDDIILENRIMGPNVNPGENMNMPELRPITFPGMEQPLPIGQAPPNQLAVRYEEEDVDDDDVIYDNGEGSVDPEEDEAAGGPMYEVYEPQPHPPPYAPVYLPPMLPAIPLDVNQNINSYGWQTTMSFFQQAPAQAPPTFKMRQPRGRFNKPAGSSSQNYNQF